MIDILKMISSNLAKHHTYCGFSSQEYGTACPRGTHLGVVVNEGTWHSKWKTLGHVSQHKSSPPLWQTAHQSSLLLLLEGGPNDEESW